MWKQLSNKKLAYRSRKTIWTYTTLSWFVYLRKSPHGCLFVDLSNVQTNCYKTQQQKIWQTSSIEHMTSIHKWCMNGQCDMPIYMSLSWNEYWHFNWGTYYNVTPSRFICFDTSLIKQHINFGKPVSQQTTANRVHYYPLFLIHININWNNIKSFYSKIWLKRNFYREKYGEKLTSMTLHTTLHHSNYTT